MLDLSLNKNWPRTGAGKFITIYPSDDDQFFSLLEACSTVTAGMEGPYILSDRPFRDSKVVFYRYGEHSPRAFVGPTGTRTPLLVGPSGECVSDDRQAYFALPPWVTDTVSNDPPITKPGEDGVLLNNRYRVTSAERFSSIGGIYGAVDTHSGKNVIIRETRPRLGTRASGYNPLAILRKEARILTKLGPTGFTPRFIELFQEWEHWFLVQERLDAESLWGYAINFTHGSNAQTTPAAMFDKLRATIRKIAEGLEIVHAHNVILRDLTKSNVMFTLDTEHVRFIDLELSFETDRDDKVISGWTTGYASEAQLRSKTPSPQDDYYALGALIVDMIAFSASGLPLNKRGVLDSLMLTLRDFELPDVLLRVVEGLLDEDPSSRWNLREAMALLDSVDTALLRSTARVEDHAPRPVVPEREAPAQALQDDVVETLRGLSRHIRAAATPERTDRLWPASGDIFSTNAISVQYGAAGTAYFLWRESGEVPHDAITWIRRNWRRRLAPRGLHVGLGGLAVTLLDLGLHDDARTVFEAAHGTPLSPTSTDVTGLYYGQAGWGLANLHYWLKAGDERGLDTAITIGNALARSAKYEGAAASWPEDGGTPIGYGHGASGIALFLTYLSLATRDEAWMALARRALNFEIGQRQEVDTRLIWFANVNARVSGPKSPHIRHGTAGIGTAALRYVRATGDQDIRAFLEQCAHTVANRHTNKLWHDYGASGYGELLLDMYSVFGDERYRTNAYHLAEFILKHRMDRLGGYAFPGSELLRVSCDYGMGSAGIGLFLHRLTYPSTPRYLMLDELFDTGVHSRGRSEVGVAACDTEVAGSRMRSTVSL